MGGYCLETALWWRIDLSADIRRRLRNRVCSQDALLMSMLGLRGMAIVVWAFAVHANDQAEYRGQSILLS